MLLWSPFLGAHQGRVGGGGSCTRTRKVASVEEPGCVNIPEPLAKGCAIYTPAFRVISGEELYQGGNEGFVGWAVVLSCQSAMLGMGEDVY